MKVKSDFSIPLSITVFKNNHNCNIILNVLLSKQPRHCTGLFSGKGKTVNIHFEIAGKPFTYVILTFNLSKQKMPTSPLYMQNKYSNAEVGFCFFYRYVTPPGGHLTSTKQIQ